MPHRVTNSFADCARASDTCEALEEAVAQPEEADGSQPFGGPLKASTSPSCRLSLSAPPPPNMPPVINSTCPLLIRDQLAE